ncbi:MAG: hypothetical protein K1X64_20695 [Myxococcaceae bacterium]|nr:hypothetical protein [Myxococcaceae bacterium]
MHMAVNDHPHAQSIDFGYPARLSLMLLCGALAGAVALTVVYFSTRAGTNLMLWNHLFVIPVGPFLVGLIAGSGFAFGCRLSGVKVTGVSLGAVCLMLVSLYFLGEYVGYRVDYPHGVVNDDGVLLTFWPYFDFLTRLFHYENRAALGIWGYGLRAISIAGLVLGGLAMPFVALGKRPHCASCQRFHQYAVVGCLPEENQTAINDVLEARPDPIS